jgi:hypothetical protein
MGQFGFKLRKYSSNSAELLKEIPEDLRATDQALLSNSRRRVEYVT